MSIDKVYVNKTKIADEQYRNVTYRLRAAKPPKAKVVNMRLQFNRNSGKLS